MKNSTRELSYVPVDDPLLIRKQILLGAVEVIGMLEKHEDVKKIRNEKRKFLLEIKSKLTGLDEDCSSLHNLFPEISKREIIHESRQMEEKVDTVKTVKKAEGLKHLERELRELQDKLNSLEI